MTERERPTATVSRVDMSSARRASAAPSSSEAVLFRAYGTETGPGDIALFRVTKSEAPCACGGVIKVSGRAIEAAIRTHNATPRHATWRTWRETE